MWIVVAVGRTSELEVELFRSAEGAYRFAYKWVMEETGGPSAWREDEWPQMRAAIKDRNVPAMIEYYNAQFSKWTDGFVLVEKRSAKK